MTPDRKRDLFYFKSFSINKINELVLTNNKSGRGPDVARGSPVRPRWAIPSSHPFRPLELTIKFFGAADLFSTYDTYNEL
jgi:hypothetical protein